MRKYFLENVHMKTTLFDNDCLKKRSTLWTDQTKCAPTHYQTTVSQISLEEQGIHDSGFKTRPMHHPVDKKISLYYYRQMFSSILYSCNILRPHGIHNGYTKNSLVKHNTHRTLYNRIVCSNPHKISS